MTNFFRLNPQYLNLILRHAMPLISIIVTTYNSSKYIIETLESAKLQTWQNIELIVSDDCSKDNTVELCSKWIENNKDRFARTAIITVPQNTGVSANCNRCIKASNSEWIKFIAGDDILLPNCIEDNMKFVNENAEVSIIFSQVIIYENEFIKENLVAYIPEHYPMNLMDPAFDSSHQFKLLLLSDRINYTPSYFFKKQSLLDVGCYDEENKLVEDYPMWLKLTNNGNKLFYFHQPTVGYRRHQQALNNIKDDGLFKPLFLKSAALKEKYVFPHLPWDIVGSEKHVLLMSKLFQKMGMNRKTVLFTMLYKIATVFLNPFRYVIYFKKRILNLGNHNIFYAN